MATATAAASSCLALSALSPVSSSSSSLARSTNLVSNFHGQGLSPRSSRRSSSSRSSRRRATSGTRAAKLPQGVEAPKEEPKLPASFWGFTENAEVWNSRASMIGLFGLILLEYFAKKGLLEMIGVDVGKGLDLPL